MRKQFELALTALMALGLLACGSPPVKEPERTGFISDYSNLVMEEDQSIELLADEAYVYFSDRLVNYRAFMLDDIVMLFKPDPEESKLDQEELAELLEHARTELEQALTQDDYFSVTTEAGDGVARLRLAITEVEATIGALNFSSYTRVTGAGLGGAAAEGEVVDSVTGEQLAAAIRWGGGNRIGKAGLTKTGDAKLILSRWAKNFREDLDSLHGVSGD